MGIIIYQTKQVLGNKVIKLLIVFTMNFLSAHALFYPHNTITSYMRWKVTRIIVSTKICQGSKNTVNLYETYSKMAIPNDFEATTP